MWTIFLIYINDLLNSLQSNPKLFADDTSLFSTVQDITTSTVSLNHNLSNISEWAAQWKINFNLDQYKEAQELLFIQSHIDNCILMATPFTKFNSKNTQVCF